VFRVTDEREGHINCSNSFRSAYSCQKNDTTHKARFVFRVTLPRRLTLLYIWPSRSHIRFNCDIQSELVSSGNIGQVAKGGWQTRCNWYISRSVTLALFWETLDLFLQAIKTRCRCLGRSRIETDCYCRPKTFARVSHTSGSQAYERRILCLTDLPVL
jgi:hypothetical protein